MSGRKRTGGRQPATGNRQPTGGRRPRLEGAIRDELAGMLPREVSDPRVLNAGLMTVTKVELSADLTVAKIGVSFVGGDDPEDALKALNGMAGYLRGEIGRRLALRHGPELRFLQDRSGEHAARIDALLKEDS